MRVLSSKFTDALAITTALILAIMPFHAFLTVWFGSEFDIYTAIRLWKELLLGLLALGAAWTLFKDQALRQKLKNWWLFWLIVAYADLHLLLGLWALASGQVTPEAFAYGLVANLRFLLFFVICLVIAYKVGWLKDAWQKLLFWPAALVVVIGLWQVFLLPAGFLTNFGYGPETIPAFQTVDQKLEYLRVQSTLRGSNPLGAYLVLVLAAITSMLAVHKKTLKNILVFGLFGVLSLIVLAWSFSRSAYLGALVAIALTAWFLAKNSRIKSWLVATILVIFIGGLAFAYSQRQSDILQNLVFHTDQTSQMASSNDIRLDAQLQSSKEVIAEPFGRGPGTAGPASVYNDGQVRLAENYYLQIAQETGWLGLALFLAILSYVAALLWHKRAEPLYATLLASGIGLLLINLVSHAWTDDTLSLLWWGLAGIALASTFGKTTKVVH